MAIHFIILILSILILSPAITHSLSTIAISETGNQTLVCAVAQTLNPRRQFLNCTSSPQRTQLVLNASLESISGVVGGNGFVCALSSFYSVSTSIMMCWRFLDISNINPRNYTRVYNGSVLTEFESGYSRFCGVSNGSLSCWPWRNNGPMGSISSSNFAVGENNVCGLSNLGRVRCLRNFTNVPEGDFSQIAAGFNQVCAISLMGSLVCPGTTVGEMPQGVFKGLALGENRGCVIRRINGSVVCWGENGFRLPDRLRDESFVTIEARRRVFCGVATSNYSLFCWGNEDFDSNSLVLSSVVPGPCRPANECRGDYLPGYGQYCDEDLKICLSPILDLQPPSRTSSRKWTRSMIAFLVVGCVGSSLFLLAIVFCVFSCKRSFRATSSRIHDSGQLEGGSPQESEQPNRPWSLKKKLSHLISMGNRHLEEFAWEFLVEVTENFSEEHMIGTGSFGLVYYAKLDDGREVAIKRAGICASSLSAGTPKRGQEDKDYAFLNELEFLSRLNHKNLVRLFGFCEDCDERVLVYEFMNNGSLSDHLHKLESSSLNSWATRIKVALDAARGIEYLHEFAVPRVIHRDIKSSNILLDDMLTAKVSDFGLSLLGPQDDEGHLSLCAAGTMGYMDPEYYRLQMLTTKSDVYSFGIVLLELLSGYRAIHKNERGEPRNVVDFVIPHIVKDDIHRILDRRVPPPTPFEIEAVAFVGYLAADCVMPEGYKRPTMSEVVNSLDRALETCLAPPVLSRSTTDSSA